MDITFEPITQDEKDALLANYRTRRSSEVYDSFLNEVMEQDGFVRVVHVETYFSGAQPVSIVSALKKRIKEGNLTSNLLVWNDDNLGVVVVKS